MSNTIGQKLKLQLVFKNNVSNSENYELGQLFQLI